ncbi:integrase catalytic domain-containing protein [Trichonephila clavipes]|nr:integrase catalytic domain-containing protein [Trichonephila clavipes]
MVTKAYHLEIVTDLSSEAFIAALKRFFSRRGKSERILSDNATNFVGTQLELKRLREIMSNCVSNLSKFLCEERVEWSFIPPRAPNHGGLWEAGVKAVKYHLRRVMGNLRFTYEEFLTILNQIEGVLNSRPLYPLSCDPGDFDALTPGHFLVGRPITAIAEPSLTEVSDNRINHYNSIFTAEALAICQALDDLVEFNVNLLVLSDSLSVPSALQNFSIKSHKVIHRLPNKIYMLSNYIDQLILLWIPGHSKIVWNEQADNLARSVTESNVYIDWIASEDTHKNIYRNRIKKINEKFYSSKYFEKLGNIPTIDIISKWTENRREEILSTRIFSKMIHSRPST